MTTEIVHYQLEDGVATITMNDGGKNLMAPAMIKQLNAALDRAEKDKAVVILTGYDTIFSAGFDLKVMKKGATQAFSMLIGGFELSARLLEFPLPIVIACNGHSIAMGTFLLLSGDYRIGTAGDFKIAANEVAIGMSVPHSSMEVCRQRLNPAHLVRATTLAEYYNPESGLVAGFFDQVVAASDLLPTATALARSYTKLDLVCHHETKKRLRKDLHKAVRQGIKRDRLDLVAMGLKRLRKSKK